MNINPVGKFSSNIVKKAVTQLGKPGALLPVALLEVTVDTGRGYNAYKRGGFTEFRERITDDVSAGVFWLFGAVWLNKLGNHIGKKFLGIKNPEFSFGQDKARNGMEQALSANAGISKNKLSLFKFGKVASSIAIAIAFIGWGLPKINQSITKKMSDKKKETSTNNKPQDLNEIKKLFDDFMKYKHSKKSEKPSFGAVLSPETIGKIAHNLEHNATWRLGTTDGGILVGRTTNAWKRSHDEAIEYGFRDAVSSYFYLWAPGHIVSMFNKFDAYKGKNTSLDPESVVRVSNYLSEKVLKDGKMSVNEFKNAVFGTFDTDKFNLVKSTLEKNKGNISVEEFVKLTGANKDLQRKAELMSKLQPKLKGVSILTDKQVEDVLTSGKITDPKFLYRTINNYYADSSKKLFGKLKGRVMVKTLKDKLGFISASDIEATRGYIFNYTQSIIEMAEKQAQKTGKPAEITIDLLKKASKRNAIYHSTYLGVGLGVSILFLSTLIPKMQYMITKWRTGNDGFPGANQNKAA